MIYYVKAHEKKKPKAINNSYHSITKSISK